MSVLHLLHLLLRLWRSRRNRLLIREGDSGMMCLFLSATMLDDRRKLTVHDEM